MPPGHEGFRPDGGTATLTYAPGAAYLTITAGCAMMPASAARPARHARDGHDVRVFPYADALVPGRSSTMPKRSDPLPRLRAICMAMPQAEERLSHGEPTWFVAGKKVFASFSNNHHGDGRVAVVCAAPDGAQEAFVRAMPDRFYVPPYVGHRGWIGVRLDVPGVDWGQVAAIVEDAYRVVAPAKLSALILSGD
jgi:hypothetical protein